MNLLLHQLKLEFRRQGFLLGAYYLVLLAAWAFAAGHLGDSEVGPDGVVKQSHLVVALVTLGFLFLFPALVGATILADSPAEHDGFLSSRPLPARSLYVAKALFILLGVIVPVLLAEVLSLRAIGMPTRILWLGALDRVLLLLPVTVAVALFCAHWKSAFTAMLAAGVAIGLSVGLGALIGFVTELLRTAGLVQMWIRDPSALTVSAGCAALALGLVWTVRGVVRRGPLSRVIVGVSLFFVLGTTVALLLPFRELSIPGPSQALLEREVPDLSGRVEVEGVEVRQSAFEQDGELDRIHFQIVGSPVLAGLPAHWEPQWGVSGYTLHSGESVLAHSSHYRWNNHLTVVTASDAGVSKALRQALASAAPEARLLLPSHSSRSTSEHLVLGFHTFPLDQRPASPMSLESELSVWVSEWREVMNSSVPRTEPVEVAGLTVYPLQRDGAGRRDSSPRISIAESAVRPTTIRLGPSRAGHAEDRRVVALYLPSRRAVYLGTQGGGSSQIVGSVERRITSFNFRDESRSSSLTEAELQEARLIILESRELGHLRTSYTSEPLPVPPAPESDLPARPAYAEHEQITEAELAGWLREQAGLPEPATDARLRPYLAEVVSMADRARSYRPEPGGFLVSGLARFVPGHFPVFLAELERRHPNSTASAVLIQAIVEGATEDQKEEMLGALGDDPRLIEVVVARGWIAEARGHLLDRLSLEHQVWTGTHWRSYLSCLLVLDDPEADGRVLKYFRDHPHYRIYAELCRIPRLRERLDEMAPRPDVAGLLVVPESGFDALNHPLRFALAQGDRDSLAPFFLLVRTIMEEQDYFHGLTDILVSHFRIPDELWDQRHNDAVMAEWFLRHTPDHFVFDAVLERFVLNPEPSS